jgi:hypothetical protein
MSANSDLSEKAQLGKKLAGEFLGERFYSDVLASLVKISLPSPVLSSSRGAPLELLLYLDGK